MKQSKPKKPDEAWNIVNKIKAICKEEGLWIFVKTEEKPDLEMIRIEEISIKIDE